MSSIKFKAALIGFALIFSLGACNYPGVTAPTPFAFPTPNATLTAVFSPTQAGVATITPPPSEVPATQASEPIASSTSPVLPTATIQFPTSTPVIPTATATQVPPTATIRPTNTPVPTVSYAGPGSRSGTSLVAAYQDRNLIIDGLFDDWNQERYRLTSVVEGASNHNGEADLSSSAMISWDENNLYIAARVRDDVYAQNAGGEQIFRGDSLEVLLDTNVSADYYLQALSSDDYQLGISPGRPQPGGSPESYLWYPQAEAGGRQRVKVGAMAVDDGYRVEVAIPWNIFNVTPKSGQHFGFALSISDNDRPSENLQQSMVSSVSTRRLTDPTTWGDLTLSGTPAPRPNPENRPGTSLEAVYLGSQPVLDGNLSEWNLASTPIGNVVYGKDKWDSSADLSGSLMIGWDEDNLFLAVRVVDNRYVQNTSGENIFLGDSLELLLDTEVPGDYYQQSLSEDDYQLGLSPGRPAPGSNLEAYLWYPRSSAGSRAQVRISALATSDGYVLEAAIPWRTFSLIPGAGQHFGFVISISDNDNPDREIQQSMVSNVAARVLTDPTTWGDLVLLR